MGPDDKLFVISEPALQLKPDASINQHGLYAAKFKEPINIQSSTFGKNYLQFGLSVLKMQYHWLEQFLRWTHQYLDQRIAFGQALTKHDAIRYSLAEVIENMMLIQPFLNSKITTTDLLTLSDLLLAAIKKLANCTGGRSFAGGNILEFYYISQLVNHFLCQ